MTKIFLTVLGIAYLALAGWCMSQPAKTAASIGFEFRSASGQSEYFTIYGGLQLGLGLIFLFPLVRPDSLAFALIASLLVHGGLILARGISLVLYSGISSMTWGFAVLELVLFLVSLLLWTKQS
ncbi:MAG: DUF4345 family protein [Planctomycetota bacterium]